MLNPERFSDAAKRMCTLAMSDAVRLKHPCVGTEHLLCAILGDPKDSRGKRALVALGVQPVALLQQLLALEIPLSKNKPPLALAPIAERVLHRAAMTAGVQPVDTSDFLIAMANEDCAAVKMLGNLGVTPKALIYRAMTTP